MTESISPELVWIGSIFHRTGYSAATRNHLRGLHRLGFPVHVQELWRNSKFLPSDEDMLWYSQMSRRKPAPGAVCVVMHPPTLLPEGLSILEHCRATNPGMGRYIAYTMFESDRLPGSWVERLEAAEEIWVPTQFNRESFLRSGVEESKLRVMPLGIDTELFSPRRHFPKRDANETEFKFLSAFEWLPRKGWDILVRAYCQEFSKDERVSLTLRTYRGLGGNLQAKMSIAEELEQFVRREFGKGLGDLPAIRIDESRLSDEELPAYYLGHNAFVSTSRGEGWGMPMMEAMSLGLPTAAPRWGGQLEFMSDRNSYLIEIDGVVPVAPNMVLENAIYAGHRWAEPSLEATRRVLRQMFAQPQEGIAKASVARAEIGEKFSLAAVAKQVARRVEELAAMPRKPDPVKECPAEERSPLRLAMRTGSTRSFGHQRVDYELLRALGGQAGVQMVSESENPQILLSHDDPASLQAPPAGCRWIWFARVSDGEDIPQAAIPVLRAQVDEIWVTSAAQREAYVSAGIPESKIRIAPLGVDTKLFSPGQKPLDLEDSSGFRIMSVLSLDERQSFESLLGAYTAAFQNPDDVCLVLKITSTDPERAKRGPERQMLERLRECPAFPKMLVIDEDLGEEEMAKLYAACDLFFAPYAKSFHRSAVLEAMAAGVPVIAPHDRTPQGPVQEGRAFPFPVHPKTNLPYERTLAELLKSLRSRPDLLLACATRARRFVEEERSWSKTAAWMRARMQGAISRATGTRKDDSFPWPFVAVIAHGDAAGGGALGAIRRAALRHPQAVLRLETSAWEASFDALGELAGRLERNPGAIASVFCQDDGAVGLWRPQLRHLRLPPIENFRSGAFLLDLIREVSLQGQHVDLAMRSGIRFRVSADFLRECRAVEALVLAQELRAGGRADEAFDLVHLALREKNDYAAAMAEKIELLLETGRGKESVALARDLVAAVPGWSRSRHLLGIALVNTGQESEGGVWVYQANAMDPANPLIAFDLGELFERAGDPSQAFQCYRRAWSQDSGRSETLIRCMELLAENPLLPGAAEFVGELGQKMQTVGAGSA